ncbi:alpha/beta hydrolase [Subtercola sp. RTI3]|uniref:alpha/beta hydrolase n=1 Tax=Subtercola sp. RTI3 TaxID=3048639 RepID=UPI002B223CF6|nr:alpha/beta hydrolase-fold protein [Subtercola sp. RTI3]MEA9985936.1 alpha/beta hydrolase-fold protein [Subtercola sp. RTI3]
MFDSLLNLNIVQGPVIIGFAATAAVFGLYLLIRRPGRRWIVTAASGLVGGALAGIVTLVITVYLLDLFGTRLSPLVDSVIVLTFAAVGLAIVNLWLSRWWRKLIAVLGIAVFIATGTLGVNAVYGLNKTVAAFFGVTNAKPLVLPSASGTPTPAPVVDPNAPLYESWMPPADLPATGQLGTVNIPHDVSGFIARTALAYVPPAGLVANAPALPVIIQLNGQPGSPGLDDPKVILDKLAAANRGLAPIVVNPDQLGDDTKDPLCLDTSKGNVETYLMKDVVPWVKAHFNVLSDPKDWTIMGFSNGGMCASYFGAKYPSTFGNFVDISGDEYQGVDDKSTLKKMFGGNQAAYEAVWPTTIMSKSTYPDSWAVFAVGADDAEAIPGVKTNYDAAVAAGIHATYTAIPGSGHDNTALDGGLSAGYTLIYQRGGLSAPPTG